MTVLFFWILIALNKTSDNLIKDQEKNDPLYKVTVKKANGESEVVSLNDYLVGVVAGEMPLSFEDEAIKAQIVASRTFVFSRDLQVDNTTSTQVYLSRDQLIEKWQSDYQQNYQRLLTLVEQTNNEVLKYNNHYISALFFSSSNGKTENSEDYFVSSGVPYLKSVDSSWDLTICPNNQREVSFTFEQLNDKFNLNINNIEILSRKDSGRVDEVMVNETKYTGRQIRELLNLASSDFTVEKTNNGYTFYTIGYGHGVGMSQYGANGMALEGYQYQEILQYYYQGVEISSL